MLISPKIIPRISDYFGELCDIVPPTRRGQGWLVTLSHPIEARILMEVGSSPMKIRQR